MSECCGSRIYDLTEANTILRRALYQAQANRDEATAKLAAAEARHAEEREFIADLIVQRNEFYERMKSYEALLREAVFDCESSYEMLGGGTGFEYDGCELPDSWFVKVKGVV